MTSSTNRDKGITNGSPESSAPSSSEPPDLDSLSPDKSDPLVKLEELLNRESFDNERISVVFQEPPPRERSLRPSADLIKQVAQKHKRLAAILTLMLGLGAWAKVIAELVSGFR